MCFVVLLGAAVQGASLGSMVPGFWSLVLGPWSLGLGPFPTLGSVSLVGLSFRFVLPFRTLNQKHPHNPLTHTHTCRGSWDPWTLHICMPRRMPNWIYTCIIKVLDGRAKTLNDYKKHFEEGQMEINLYVCGACVCMCVCAKDMRLRKGYLLVSNVFLFLSSFSSYIFTIRPVTSNVWTRDRPLHTTHYIYREGCSVTSGGWGFAFGTWGILWPLLRLFAATSIFRLPFYYAF